MNVASSFATSGSISTPHYKQKFNLENFKAYEEFKVNIKNPFLSDKYDYVYGNLFDQKYEINVDYDIEKKYECIIENGNCLTLNGIAIKQVTIQRLEIEH